MLAATEVLTTTCADLFRLPLELDYVSEFYAWFITGVLKATGRSLDLDVAALTACVESTPCPTNRDEILKCVLTTPEE